jgi:DNA-binding HxlR family transcriptional regulator
MAKRGRTYHCGIEAALDVVGGKWKAAIVWHLDPSPLRFAQLRRAIPGITEKMLIQQLRELVADGLVHREDYREVPPKVEYSLTDFGRSLRTVLVPLCDWGSQHMRRIGLRQTCPSGDGKTPASAGRLAGGGGAGSSREPRKAGRSRARRPPSG